MKWTIPQLQKFREKGLTLNEIVDLSSLKELSPEVLGVSPVKISGHAEIDVARVVFHLMIECELTLPCARSLVPVAYPIVVETSEVFSFDQTDDAGGVTQIKQGEGIDLYPIVQEIILLEIPIQVFAPEADQAKGAPFSGQGWELVLEENKQQKVDPRLAKLAELLDNNQD